MVGTGVRRGRRAAAAVALVAAVVVGGHGDHSSAVTPAVGAAATATGDGVWIVDASGHITTRGSASSFGFPAGRRSQAPVVGVARSWRGNGYWVAAANGAVFSFGDATFHGSAAGRLFGWPVVGIAAHPTLPGYWLVTADGRVLPFGEARSHGSMAGRRLAQPVVGIAATRTGRGYWLVARDGGVFSFGDAGFSGSAAGLRLAGPVVGMTGDPDGVGYWLAATDGGVFAFDAGFAGSAVGRLASTDRGVAIAARARGGYWVVTSSGTAMPFTNSGTTPPPTTTPPTTTTTTPPGNTTPPTTSTVPPTTHVLVGAGDIAHCGSSGDEATASLLDRIPGTVFTLGDTVYEDGTPAEYANCYAPSWGRHKARTRPAVGSHEYRTPGAAGYFGYFGAAAGEPGKGYYSYDLGAWHVVVLNSECSQVSCSSGSAQEQWLRADLAASTQACTVAYWHNPLFTSGSVHRPTVAVRPLFQALYEAGAEIVLAGDNHNYERFAPQAPTGNADRARGLRQFVVGTGGVGHYTFGAIQPNSEVRNDDTFGVLKLTLRPGSYDWEFVPEPGRTFTDRGTGTCH